MSNLQWPDTDEIAFQLHQKFPDLDPLTIRFTDLRRWVTELEAFDDSAESSEGILEQIQAAWVEYYCEKH